ncbi:MAG: efflux RND transporter periplasmic adaptor subunit [Burkholderiaceae bacterium]
MLKKILITLVGVVIVVGGIVYAKLGQFQAMGEAGAKMIPPPETVTAATAEVSQWERSIPVSGTLAAVRGVIVSAEVAGRIERITFQSGAIAKAGDILVQLDTSAEDAQLASAQAASQLARATLARRLELAKRNLVSAADVDTARAQAKEAAAQIGVVRATIDKKTVRAPFDGRLGLRQVDLGQIVSAGVPIVSLQTLDPVHVNFSVPQQQLPSLAPGLAVRVTADAAPGEVFEGRINGSAPRSIRSPATCGCRPRSPTRAATCSPACSPMWIVLPDKQEVLAIPAKPPCCTRPLATRCS